jgi:Peptidase family M48
LDLPDARHLDPLEAGFERQPHWGSSLIRRFFKWYIPYFNAVSFPFARSNEYEADAASVQLTSARNTAQALTNVHMIGSYLSQKYWPRIHAAAKEVPEPAFTPYSGFVAQDVSDVPRGELDRWREAALGETTSHIDTHPSLGDRLKAVGAPAEFAPPARGEGAEQLLGTVLPVLEQRFDSQWRARIADSWRKYHGQALEKRSRLAALQAENSLAPLDEPKSLELAALEEEVGAGAGTALTSLRETVARFPASTAARFALARNLLLDGNEEGTSTMTAVIAEEPSAVLAGSELLRDYFERRGDQAGAKLWRDRHVDDAIRLHRAEKGRGRLLLSDRYAPHELDAQTLAKLTAQLRSFKQVRRAYLVRKVDASFPAVPLYVLGIKSTAFFQLYSQKRVTRVLKQVTENVVFPGETMIISVDGNLYRFARKMRRIGHAKLV